MSNFILSCFLLVVCCVVACNGFSVQYNITVGEPRSWTIDTFTKVLVNFPTQSTSGSAVFTDMDMHDGTDFQKFSRPALLKDYTVFGVFQVDTKHVVVPPQGATFSFKHDFAFGILNVNPKEMCLVAVDLGAKKFNEIDFKFAPYYNEVTLPVAPKVFTFAILGLEKEIPAEFGQPVLVNYRASLKYNVHSNLRQYLSTFINRSLKYPSHEYVTTLVENKVPLPSKDMVEIMSFTFGPILPPSYQGGMVVHDFYFTFNESLGFLDKNGKSVSIDTDSLQCLYVVDTDKGFTSNGGQKIVFPGWQLLACDAHMGENNFYPKYVTIVANLKGTKPDVDPVVNPINSKSERKKQDNTPKNNSSRLSVLSGWILIVAIVGAFLL